MWAHPVSFQGSLNYNGKNIFHYTKVLPILQHPPADPNRKYHEQGSPLTI
jgi:hypothetical protein